MSQTFTLCIATETIASDAQQVGVTVDELNRIRVHVSADIVQTPILHLQLTYHVTLPSKTLAAQFDWPDWQQARVAFADYLWEESCLECFITGGLIGNEMGQIDHTNAYIEINASPDGRYALYKFENYRYPATLPPTPLHQTHKHVLASLEWVENIESPLGSEPSTTSNLFSYQRRFGVCLTQLSNQRYAFNDTVIEYIHPCVILRFGQTTLFFASSHASPPDFHNRDYWQKFDLII